MANSGNILSLHNDGEFRSSLRRAPEIEASEYDRADPSGCVALWLAVIHRALSDACYGWFDEYQMNKHSFAKSGIQCISPQIRTWAVQARAFLLSDRSTFTIICHLANIDPGHLRRRARQAINDVDLRVKVQHVATNTEQRMAWR